MRSTLERIRPDANSSFRLLLTPHLSDVFLWHYHPEYELAAIADLFSRAREQIRDGGETKAEVGRDLARLADLPPFDRLLLLLRVFQRLAGSAEVTRLHGEPVAGAYDLDEQRRLKRLTQFVNRYRVHEAQRLLLTDHSVTEAAFACGFESLSYFNRVFRGVTGENPLAFKRRHRSDS